MAITGTGTVEDPFLFGSYEEMKTVCSAVENAGKHAKLSKNIDCNDYGDTWEWEEFRIYTNIDFDEHYIKNAVIAPNNKLFIITPTYGETLTIEKGGILNIFNNGATGCIEGYGRNDNVIFKDIQFSLNISGMTGNAFAYISCLNCSFYICAGILYSTIFYTASYEGACFKNCDFWFDIGDINQKHISNSNSDNDTRIFDSCRFRGVIKSGVRTEEMLCHYGHMGNCVWEVDTYNTTQGEYDSSYDKLTHADSTGIKNQALCPLASNSGETNLTALQMRDADYLNFIGFTVIPTLEYTERGGGVNG